ncbi:preprotein translocase subunit SecE [Cardinium endosymbiont of Tipula unca]|uniref:preprotein translocase subunit SecE n=1 Tax=Cardinium endosymbiont of Tipula unca TaxID=3066216 RepID=UPI0030D4F75E
MVSKTIGWEFESLRPCMNNMSKLKIFILNLIQEVRYKITWPAYHKLQSSSLLVLVASFMFALLIGLIDWSFKKVFVWFYGAF